MAYNRKWKPSRTARQKFAQEMENINQFCIENKIQQSSNGDSYYFTINGKNYRVSNHTIEASNRAAYDGITGEQKRELYHETHRNDNTIYIHAGKTRIIDIYNDLQAGYQLDGKGNRKI